MDPITELLSQVITYAPAVAVLMYLEYKHSEERTRMLEFVEKLLLECWSETVADEN